MSKFEVNQLVYIWQGNVRTNPIYYTPQGVGANKYYPNITIGAAIVKSLNDTDIVLELVETGKLYTYGVDYEHIYTSKDDYLNNADKLCDILYEKVKKLNDENKRQLKENTLFNRVIKWMRL